jgi:hypothetical protein
MKWHSDRLAIGCDSIRDTIMNGVRHLQELKFYDVSIVTFQMNELPMSRL